MKSSLCHKAWWTLEIKNILYKGKGFFPQEALKKSSEETSMHPNNSKTRTMMTEMRKIYYKSFA